MDEHLDQYCERLGPQFWAEPLNAVSNLAFILAAIGAGMLLHRTRAQRADLPRDLRFLPPILWVMGIGSFLFHTVATRASMWADVLPIAVFQLAAIAILVRRLVAESWCKVAAAWAVFLASGWLIGFTLRDLQTYGSVGYLPALLVLGGTAAYLWARQPRAARCFAWAAGIFAVSLTLRTLDLPLCDRIPLGLHYFWHCLNAVVLYKVVKGCVALQPSPFVHQKTLP